MLQIHKASAGSGKTFSLTREYLRLLLAAKDPSTGRYRLHPLSSYGMGKPKHHGAILAVTFTNKATEEMTARIVSELALLASPPEGKSSPYAEEFMRDFGTDADTLRRHALTALRDLLHNYTWFNVSTIDSFFQKVLNTFTRELELTPTHAVELDDRYVLGVATGKLIASINTRRPDDSPSARARRGRLERWLHQYMLYQLREGDSFNILSQTSRLNSSMVGYMSLFFNEQYKLHRAEIDSYLADPARLDRFYRLITGEEALGGQVSALQERCRAMRARGEGLVSRFLLANMDKFIADGMRADITDVWTAAITNPEKRPKSKKTELPAHLEEELVSLLKDVDSLRSTADLYRQMRRYTFLLGLFGELNHFLEEYRQEHDSMLLSDTNDLLNRIINEEEAPFIYERLGSAIHHYLIDEFQDTSQMQWENLRPLLLESLSQGHDNLIIGDEKQCIYRFRNSDPKLLGSDVETLVRSRFPDYVSLKGVRITENCNWRSSAPVVRFNNTLFLLMAPLMDGNLSGTPVGDTYSGLIQMIPDRHLHSPGYVKVRFLSPAEEGEPDASAPAAEADTEDDLDPTDDMQFRCMVEEIDRELRAGFRPRDIAILVRKTREGKNIIARLMHMMENDPQWIHGQVPLMSSDSMSISLSPAVRMIVSVLRLATQPAKVKNPDENGSRDSGTAGSYRRYRLLHRFELCRFDLTEMTDPDGTPVTGPDGKPAMRRLNVMEAFAKAVAATEPHIGEASDPLQRDIDSGLLELAAMESPTLAAMTERIIARFLTPDARSRENAFITAFQDLVLDFSEYGNNNLLEFLKWWDQTGCRTNVAAPDGLDAISVMTIHKAKGLEFECVHVPYCSFKAVSDHSDRMKSISWYELDPASFPGIDPGLVPPLFPLPNFRRNKNIAPLRAQVEKWEAEQKTDNLNITYVAFTRAVGELHVYCPRSYILEGLHDIEARRAAGKPESEISKKEAAIENADNWFISDYILRAIQEATPEALAAAGNSDGLKDLLVPLQPLLSDDGSGGFTFTLGNPLSPQTAGDGRHTDTPSADEPSAAVRPADNADTGGDAGEDEEDDDLRALSLTMPYPEMIDTYRVYEHNEICADLDFEDLVTFDFDNDRHRGIFLHAVLSRVRHRSDLPRALAAMAYRYHITPLQRQLCLEQLSAALADERVTPWFEDYTRVLNERTLTAIFERRRPDRVVWMPDGTVAVIDYKFGQQHRASYREQVRDYVNLLSFAGYPDAQAYLWYPLEGTITRVI